MLIFTVFISCAHLITCAVPHGYPGYFEAETATMCEQNIHVLLALQGFKASDFVVACSPERKA